MAERIGFVGVGFMGHGMAKNLVEKGHPLTIMGHRNRAPVDDLIKRGAKEAKSAEDVAKNSDIVFLCVTGSPQVEALVRGANGLAAGAQKGMIIVDCSTSNPTSTVALAAELQAKGIFFCDAPLGGTPAQAEEGKLSALVGCDASIWPRLEPIVGKWAAKAVRIGNPGDGHKMKLIMNFLSMGYAAIYSEALSVGKKVGLTPQMIDSGLRGSRMDCGFYQTFFDYVLNRNREAHKFTISNAHKDVRYLAIMAATAGVPNPVGNAVKDYFAMAEAAGRGQDFVPMLSDFVAEMNGVSLAPQTGKQAAE
ncbi:MAG TPA: NAD(P)-dependent oxidoreductase [Pseudorhodoplanes sp.]|jgi:3-hydroxyisobutyrate dehydrogenase-like beta-hydroxyacid dehydrogenase|nr:NAD(P)-dependent oxidoreductase [Pseudorhodoplanes sp.]